jgi:hypothetical protein
LPLALPPPFDDEIILFNSSSNSSRDIKAEESIFSSTVPDAWWTWQQKEMKKYLDCKSVNKATRPIHSHETWVHLRRLYRQTVGLEQSTISSNDTLDGFDGVPIQAAYSPERDEEFLPLETSKRIQGFGL